MCEWRAEANRIAHLSIRELAVDPRLERALKRHRFDNLITAFDAMDLAFEDDLRGDSKTLYGILVDSYDKNPEKFVKTYEEYSKRLVEGTDQKKAKPKPSMLQTNNSTVSKRANKTVNNYTNDTRRVPRKALQAELTNTEYGHRISMHETKARQLLTELIDEYGTVYLYQLFPYFLESIDEIQEDLIHLMHTNSRKVVIPAIFSEFPCIASIVAAYKAQGDFDENALWGAYFEGFISSPADQELFKDSFYCTLEKLQLPFFTNQEVAQYYFYSTLIHSGLTVHSWSVLWDKVIIPCAQDNPYSHISGQAIANFAKRSDNIYNAGRIVETILQKTSDEMLNPLMESAFETAKDLLSVEKDMLLQSGYAVLSHERNLPINAIKGLEYLSLGKNKALERVVSLPKVKLCLLLEEEQISAKFDAVQIPSSTEATHAEIWINKKKCQSVTLSSMGSKLIMPQTSIKVDICDRYDTDIRILDIDGNELFHKAETLKRNKPKCMEFVKTSRGEYLLRSQHQKIKKESLVAYVMKPGCYLHPLSEMQIINRVDTSHIPEIEEICICKVKPGAAAQILNSRREKIAVINESYRCELEKRNIIGSTAEGLDLYGVELDRTGYNIALPNIRVEHNGKASNCANDLAIEMIVDGEKIVFNGQLQDPLSYVELDYVEVPLRKMLYKRDFCERIELHVIQKSNNAEILVYRFAVVPITEFALTQIICNEENRYNYLAKYQFTTSRNELIETDLTKSFIKAGNPFFFVARLDEPTFHIMLSTAEKHLDAFLALAAIKIEIPESWNTEQKYDITNLPKGHLSISSIDQRYNRFVSLVLCENDTWKLPYLLESLPTTKKIERQPFSSSDSIGRILCPKRESTVSLRLFVYYNRDLKTGQLSNPVFVDLCKLQTGFGPETISPLFNRNGQMLARLDSPAKCDVQLRFTEKMRLGEDKPCCKPIEMKKGQLDVVLPEKVKDAYHKRRTVKVNVIPLLGKFKKTPRVECAINKEWRISRG